jgi:hypothetical protein
MLEDLIALPSHMDANVYMTDVLSMAKCDPDSPHIPIWLTSGENIPRTLPHTFVDLLARLCWVDWNKLAMHTFSVNEVYMTEN